MGSPHTPYERTVPEVGGAVPTMAMSHVTVEDPELDLDVERRDYDETYTSDRGA